jgi:hypothetical protein
VTFERAFIGKLARIRPTLQGREEHMDGEKKHCDKL